MKKFLIINIMVIILFSIANCGLQIEGDNSTNPESKFMALSEDIVVCNYSISSGNMQTGEFELDEIYSVYDEVKVEFTINEYDHHFYTTSVFYLAGKLYNGSQVLDSGSVEADMNDALHLSAVVYGSSISFECYLQEQSDTGSGNNNSGSGNTGTNTGNTNVINGNLVTFTKSGTVGSNQWKHFGPFSVTDGNISVKMTGSNDADLHVRKGAQPTDSNYDCRPYNSSTNEECNEAGPGEFFVSVKGYAASSDFILTINF